jgi:hypothetical protein
LDERPVWPSAIDSSTLEIMPSADERVDCEVCQLFQ